MQRDGKQHRTSHPVLLIQYVGVLLHHHRQSPGYLLAELSSGFATKRIPSLAWLSSLITCAIGAKIVALSARTYTNFAPLNRLAISSGSALMFTLFSFKNRSPLRVMLTTGRSSAVSRTCFTSGTLTSIPNSIT